LKGKAKSRINQIMKKRGKSKPDDRSPWSFVAGKQGQKRAERKNRKAVQDNVVLEEEKKTTGQKDESSRNDRIKNGGRGRGCD